MFERRHFRLATVVPRASLIELKRADHCWSHVVVGGQKEAPNSGPSNLRLGMRPAGRSNKAATFNRRPRAPVRARRGHLLVAR